MGTRSKGDDVVDHQIGSKDVHLNCTQHVQDDALGANFASCGDLNACEIYAAT